MRTEKRDAFKRLEPHQLQVRGSRHAGVCTPGDLTGGNGMTPIQKLQIVIRKLHRVNAQHVESVPVVEQHLGKVILKGPWRFSASEVSRKQTGFTGRCRTLAMPGDGDDSLLCCTSRPVYHHKPRYRQP